VTGRQYGTLGLAGVGFFVLALLALPFLDPDLSLVHEYISVYGRGDYGLLLRIGMVVGGLGTIAIGLGLRRTVAPAKRVTTSWFLIVITGLGFIAAGLFVTDPTGAYEAGTTTLSGTIHDLAGLIGFLSLVISTWMLRGVFARDAAYKHLAGAAMWFALVLTVAFLLLWFVAPAWGLIGVVQRVYVAAVLLWLLVLAANIRRTATSSGAREPKPSAK
jgi:hypothetical membrane protein